jgi:hypothetical protein
MKPEQTTNAAKLGQALIDLSSESLAVQQEGLNRVVDNHLESPELIEPLAAIVAARLARGIHDGTAQWAGTLLHQLDGKPELHALALSESSDPEEARRGLSVMLFLANALSPVEVDRLKVTARYHFQNSGEDLKRAAQHAAAGILYRDHRESAGNLYDTGLAQAPEPSDFMDRALEFLRAS